MYFFLMFCAVGYVFVFCLIFCSVRLFSVLVVVVDMGVSWSLYAVFGGSLLLLGVVVCPGR